ncbi:LysR family transcriptional regulator [Bdellovibrio svalbardensis]|uniref:LysR family transcriptional regulator n=1 Tax=Bdellovibrio svalbardensis TaxID=2972972 RepID=A0ABT6DG02_9BACT|nr:LysR family transcriptional regulator [Bdellovibrio svalbardensis]MDG0815767.1 LysR family transcriptional regulator [Bdellovibrio svalbardensis]
MNEPNIHHLKYFSSAAKLGSLAAAAKACNVSQPAISQGIRKLEETLGCELMIHTKNRFKLTDEGKLLVGRAEEIFKTLTSIRSDIDGSLKELSGTVKIATADTLAQSLLPKSLQKLRHKHPLLSAEINFGDVPAILEQVRSGQVDLGIIVDDGRVQGVHKSILHEGVFVCAAGKNQKVSGESASFLATKESPGVDELQKIFKKKFGKPATIAMQVESWEVIAKFCTLGMGVGFLPDLLLKNWDNLRPLDEFKELASKQKYRVLLIHQGDHQLTRQAKAFVDLLL